MYGGTYRQARICVLIHLIFQQTLGQYMVLVPLQLYAQVPEKACVILNHLNETVTLSMDLEYGTESRNLLTDLVADRDSFQCSPFIIPELPSSTAFITVQIKGTTQHFKKRKPIHIIKVENLVFVQTDKPVYKPGQTVRFRIVSVDINFHPFNETVSLISNPKKNRIFQWQSLKLQGGLSQLSFPLSVEPILGPYKITLLKESGKRIEHFFEVKEYGKNYAGIRYTYGKPVPGLVTINVCRKYSRHLSACHKGEFEIHRTVQLHFFSFSGLELTGYESCEITNILSKLKFTKADSHYRPGLPFFGQVLLIDEKDQPIPNQNLTVRVNGATFQSSFTTNEHGLANISFDTTSLKTLHKIKVIYKRNSNCFDNWWLMEVHAEAQHTASHVFSPSKSYVHLELVAGTLMCGQTQEIRTHYILNEQILKDEKELTFYYLVRISITVSLSHCINPKIAGKHFLTPFLVPFQLTKSSTILLYTILPNGEIVADTQKLKIENCLANKVNLSFSSAQGLPASNTHLKVTATPFSLCALRAVDHSVLLMKPEAELSPQSVSTTSDLDLTECSHSKTIFGCCDCKGQVFLSDRHDVIPHQSLNKALYMYHLISFCCLLTDRALLFTITFPMTSTVFTLWSVCCLPIAEPQALPVGIRGPSGMVSPLTGTTDSPTMQVKETIRKYFPETWIWDLVVLDELAMKVPDSITEWKAGALCLSGTTGLGLSKTVSFQVFQPFFLDLTLPYSVVRGEAFTLKATVSNYLSHCIQVKVQLEVSSSFLATPIEDNEESHCVCGNGQKTVSWAVTPKSLGKVNFTATADALQSQEPCGNEVTEFPALVQKDTVVKSLIVENISLIFPSLICIYFLSLDTEVSEKLSLRVPSNVVAESARATYSVLGDILGSAMHNLQNLLQMPYGCGEQNMVLFVPNIYVLNYLNETQQLTEKIKSKAIGYLVSGYQRQLNYKHRDGSYSTFGEQDGRSQGNTWLTAFVLKSFSQAQSYIFVENSHITDALTWLSQKQKENGCFQLSGSLLNNAMKGGVDDEVTLSAYITIALLEMPLPATHNVVRNALFCLETAWGSISETQGIHVYTKALLAYAFALAGKQARRSELLESLGREAVREEDSMHWQRPGNVQEAKTLYQPRAPSAEVEMTSYVLLAYLTTWPTPSSEDLSVASRIVKWIIKQQNPFGGFSSTQDTVVALQALSKYGAATFTKSKKAALVTIKSSKTFSEVFQVDDTNRLLLQEVMLPEIPGNYSTTVLGSGCVYLQTSLRYNIAPKKEGKVPFTLQVDSHPKKCDGVDAHRKFQIHVNISYTGERPSSNMVIVDVKMISGFIPVKPSVKKLIFDSNSFLLFFQLTNQVLSFSFLVEQDIQVENLKPAVVKAYDYYETDEFTIEEYSAPCSAGTV
uniref:Pregnancy zone protein-like n=1 Tax=Sciurus vulgaris TaxID=55149 RepID=A0A8D2CXP7_SCIVU